MSDGVPALDIDAEDPYPDDDIAAATVQAMMKHQREADAAVNATFWLVHQPYDEEPGEMRSYFDLVIESANVLNLGSPPPFLHFEKRGKFWKDNIESWSELPQVEVPIEFRGHKLPRVLTSKVYACRYCDYSTRRSDWILGHIRDKHPQVEGPLCVARDEADFIDPDDVETECGTIPRTLSEFGIADGGDA